jgi:hypothetical protein
LQSLWTDGALGYESKVSKSKKNDTMKSQTFLLSGNAVRQDGSMLIHELIHNDGVTYSLNWSVSDFLEKLCASRKHRPETVRVSVKKGGRKLRLLAELDQYEVQYKIRFKGIDRTLSFCTRQFCGALNVKKPPKKLYVTFTYSEKN